MSAYNMHDFVMLKLKNDKNQVVTVFGDNKTAERLQEWGYKISNEMDDEDEYLDAFKKFSEYVNATKKYIDYHGTWGGCHLAEKL